LDRPSAGRLVVLGQDLTDASDRELDSHRRDRIGVVEQHYRRALSPYLRVKDAIGLPLALRGVPAAERGRRVAELLERIGLPDRGDAFRHATEWRRSSSASPSPSRSHPAAAAPRGRADRRARRDDATSILDVLRDLVRAEGSTCVVVTHDELVERVADRVIHLADGRAIAERVGGPGTPRSRSGTRRAGWLRRSPSRRPRSRLRRDRTMAAMP
jgi:ABC-type lipoprotein export system ATPase subunit